MTLNLKLAAARAERDAARARLLDDVDLLKEQFSGPAIADRAMGQAHQLVEKRPGTLATIAGGTMLFLFRRPLGKWLSHKVKQRRATADDTTS